jgi:hypothetical protein
LFGLLKTEENYAHVLDMVCSKPGFSWKFSKERKDFSEFVPETP